MTAFSDNHKARVIAFYLPQFHPIPENDEWWGKGFTEWTNTAKAKPRFKGHYQPHVPADLGFYDLRVSESRIAQAEMAKGYGIEAFCYYHYWFGGKQLLERPFNEVLESGEPDFPFCLCWANQTWTGIWHGAPNRVLIEQTYPGDNDNRQHFDYLLKAFHDKRYLLVEGKPVFVVYDPFKLPDMKEYTDGWREMAFKAGLPGLFILGSLAPDSWNPISDGFDGCVTHNLPPIPRRIPKMKDPIKWLFNKYDIITGKPTIYSYEETAEIIFSNVDPDLFKYPTIIPNWDNTPRSGSKGRVLHGSTPELFRSQVKMALDLTKNITPDKRLLFVKSWNEWAEGNHLEPDLLYGKAYLEVLRQEVCYHP